MISVANGLQISVDGSTETSNPFNLATISDSVTIEGNNARLVGNPQKPFFAPIGTDILLKPSFSFLKVGSFHQDNSNITVSISNLNTNGLNRIAEVSKGAFDALISAEDATLNISNSRIERSAGGGAISLVGGKAKVVGTVLFGSGGLSAMGGTSQPKGTVKFVNSRAYLTGPLLKAGWMETGAGLSDNATILTGLNQSNEDGVPLTVAGLSDQIPYAVYPGGGSFGADSLSRVRPTSTQSATNLQTLFPNNGLLTGSPGIPVIVDSTVPLVECLLPYPAGAVPADPGVLIGMVPDAGPGGANELFNPIDASPITTDVFGQPRTTSGRRDVGAVRKVPGPLPLLVPTLAAATGRSQGW